VGIDRGAVPIGERVGWRVGCHLAARVGMALPGNIAQRRFHRRPELALVGRELETLPDAGDLGVVDHRVAGAGSAREDRRMGDLHRPLGGGGNRAVGARGRPVRIGQRLRGRLDAGGDQLRRQRRTDQSRSRGRLLGSRRIGGGRIGGGRSGGRQSGGGPKGRKQMGGGGKGGGGGGK